MGYHIKEHQYVSKIPSGEYLLVADIGGTNTNFAVVQEQDTAFQLLLTLHTASQDVQRYDELVQQICDRLSQQYGIQVRSGCFGIAGIIQDHCRCVEPTNLQVTLDAHQITNNTPLEELIIVNDFVIVATGIDHVAADDLICVIDGDGVPEGNKAALGAGTGLGKVGMQWHRPAQQYIPIASEGGHSDFAIHDILDYACAEYIRHKKEKQAALSWEDMLAGKAIRYIYQFLGTQKAYPDSEVAREIASHEYTPDKISEYADREPRARETFDLYARWYGRCAKNWALEMLGFNGIYIAGGIASKNISLFHSVEFRDAFHNSDVHDTFLRKTPVYVIADYNVSLYGAAAYYRLWKQNIV